MCGHSKYADASKLQPLIANLVIPSDYSSRLAGPHVAGEQVAVLISQGDRVVLTPVHWGFGDVYNARAETLDTRGFWHEVRHQHCIFALTSFTEGGKKFYSPEVLWAEGVWGYNNEERSAAMLTTESNDVVRPFHRRMPCFVKDPHKWLDAA